MTGKDKILLHTPPALQSFITTLGSRLRYRRRFGSAFSEAMAYLEANERLSRKELLSRQAALIRKTLREAGEHVPFYRRNGHSCEDLSEWPILDKETVRLNPDEFRSDRWPKRSLVRADTSGTSGTPLTVFSTEASYQWEMAFRWRHRAWAGIPFGAKGAYISGHLVAPPTRRRPPFWVFDRAENRLLLSSYHLSEENLKAYAAALNEFAPDFVHGYPSSLLLMAQALLRFPRQVRPKAVFAASETLLAHQREVIEEAFGCKVFVWYGQTEMTLNIVECERGSLHAREDYGVLEVTAERSAIGTGLQNPAMPMIRYRTADAIEPREGECDCGRPFGLVRSIEGRIEDYIITPGGTRVGRLDHLFKGAAGVIEAQVVQDAIDRVRLRIVRSPLYSNETEHRIRSESHARLGAEIGLEFEYVERIDRGPGGKFQFVVSKLPVRFTDTGIDSPRSREGGASGGGRVTQAEEPCDRSH